MKKVVLRRGMPLLLTLILALGMYYPAIAATVSKLDAAVTETAKYVYNTVKSPQVGSVGGEWVILGLVRSGYEVQTEYYPNYYSTVEEYVKACGGKLHDKKYTEYSRVSVALTAIGKDPRNVAGYNLLRPLGDFDKTIWQGINGPVWALIALDSGNYPMPENKEAKTQASRDMYVDEILRRQLPDGGFSLFGGIAEASAADGKADPDITGMALQALAKYQNRADVKKATEEALDCLSGMQKPNGGFASWGTANSESCAQVIVALTELGISLEDPRFVKNNNSLIDNLLSFYIKGEGFLHTADGSGSNQMATEQAFYALVAAQRARDGKTSLYRMSDAEKAAKPDEKTSTGKVGLKGKHADVKAVPVSIPGKTFQDIAAHVNQPAIEALAARGIIGGKNGNSFEPDATLTRAEFAAIVVRGLGLTAKASKVFSDVPEKSGYAGYIGTANAYGIVSGITATTFRPNGTITREEAAVMVTRAAKLCGMDTKVESAEIRDILAQFPDYVRSSNWTRTSLAFCYRENIFLQSDAEIRPKEPVRRCEIGEMIFRMLGEANLL